MRKEQKLNNKGFSLVELIIVIAIMAVLVAVLAPQFLKYVERARNSTDISNATEIVTALQVAAADPVFMEATGKNHELPTDKVDIKVGSTGISGLDGDGKFVQDALTEAGIDVTATGVKCKSKSNFNEYTISVVSDGKGGLSFTYSAAGGSDGTVFTKAMENGVKGSTVSGG